MTVRKLSTLAGVALAFTLGVAEAQIPQYGPNITREQARKVAIAAEAEARKNGWPVAIAIVDTAGQLVHFERDDNTQSGSILVAQDKAVSAAMFRRSTKVFQDAVAGGGVRYLTLRGANASEGGVPLTMGGRIVGAIGISGVNADQDGIIAKAGVDALK
jgi:glc operon protein GlcG